MEEAIQFFSENKKIFTIIHVFAVIVGMGSAVVSDILFNFYIKDKKINPIENKTLEVLSKVIWASLYFIMLSGIAIFFSDIDRYSASDKFLLKIFIVGMVIINGYLFARITHGSLTKLNFKDTNSHHKYVKIRRMSFAFGAVSLISWLCAFVLGSISSIPLSFWMGLLVYGLFLIVGIVGSQIVERVIVNKK